MRRIAFTLSAMTLATAVPLLAATPPSASALRAYENAYASGGSHSELLTADRSRL